MFTPIIITDKASGRKVHATIIEAQFYLDGFFTFDDLWEMYKDDITVQLMNGTYNPEKEVTSTQ